MAEPDARIPMLDSEAARRAGADAGVPEQLAALNIFRLLLRRPRVAKGAADLLLSMLFGGSLDPRLRELVIMRVGWVTGSDYEWTQHWRIAVDAGISPGDLVAVRDWHGHPGFGPAERAVLAATDEVRAAGAVSGDTVATLRRELGDDAAVEAVTVAAAWTMVSVVLRSCDVPLEEGVASWPPDGRGPEGTDRAGGAG